MMNKQKILIWAIGISLISLNASLNASSRVKNSECLLESKSINIRPIMKSSHLNSYFLQPLLNTTNIPFQSIGRTFYSTNSAFTSSPEISDDQAKPPRISDVFRRVLTSGGTQHNPVKRSFKNSFHIDHHWLRNYDYKRTILISNQDSKYQLLNKLISDKILDLDKKNLLKSIDLIPCNQTYKEYQARKQTQALDKLDQNLDIYLTSRNCFLDGYVLPLRGHIEFPLVLINIHARNTYDPYDPKRICWFSPIQEVIRSQTLEEHMQRLALDKLWDAYSTMTLLVIPKGTYIDCRFGIAAPRTVPNFDLRSLNLLDKVCSKKFEKDFNPLRALLNTDVHLKDFKDDQIEELFKILPGGGTQIYISSIEKYHIFNLGSFHYPDDQKKENIPTFANKRYVNKNTFEVFEDLTKDTDPTKSTKDHLWVDPTKLSITDSNHIKNLHLTNPNYLKMKLNIINVFQEWGILDKDEADEINTMIEEYRKHWYSI